jgi:N4-gp56 family major capsid protein
MYNTIYLYDLQMFADGPGVVTNTTTGTVNSYTGVEAPTTALSATMKTFYDTELLENAREKLIFQQLGRKQSLPAKHGKTVEWRKWDTLPHADKLQEGVIPDGKKLDMTSMTVTINQYGMYVTLSDQLETHAIDDAILGATEEVGASAGESYDDLVRSTVMAGANVLYADILDDEGNYLSTPALRAELVAGKANVAYLTPKMVNKAVTTLKKNKAPTYSGGKYVAVIHPSVAEDLRESKAWIEAHKYSGTTQIFNGEIGELHGVRFVESNLAPIIKEGDTAVYMTMFFGRDAFGVVDPEGAGMETIIKNRGEIGGPLEQFSTVGTKFSMASAILYEERLLRVESLSSYSATDDANVVVA